MFEHLDRFTPRMVLSVIDLHEIKHLALYNAITLATAILNDAPIAVLLPSLKRLVARRNMAAV